MTAKLHTVETLGADLLQAFPALQTNHHAETLARTLLASAEPMAGWRSAQLQRQVPTELRTRVTRLARRKYGTSTE
jgi:hypothetical protein